uniref:Uncharacterized protein n=1 Tax=Anguilla anguilla TaxID=7936 RepID=A0A0E9Q521_ANGAN
MHPVTILLLEPQIMIVNVWGLFLTKCVYH